MKSIDTNESKLTPSHQSSGGDWFVYDGDRVSGPHSADTLLSLQRPDKKNFLISRVGFARWYRLDELSGILQVTEKMAEETSRERANLTNAVDKKLDQLQQFASGASESTIESLLASKTLSNAEKKPRRLKKRTVASGFSSPSSGRPPPQNQSPASLDPAVPKSWQAGLNISSEAKSPSRQPDNRAREARLADEGSSKTQTKQRADKPVSKAKLKTRSTYEAEHEYFKLRGRLRLGQMRSGWLFAMLLWPVSLGMVAYWWYRDLVGELSFHVFNDYKARSPHPLMAIIPGANLYAFYSVGALLQAAEEQNQYRRTSPKLAMALGLIPPLAIWYLQQGANRHWRLHVNHAQKQK